MTSYFFFSRRNGAPHPPNFGHWYATLSVSHVVAIFICHLFWCVKYSPLSRLFCCEPNRFVSLRNCRTRCPVRGPALSPFLWRVSFFNKSRKDQAIESSCQILYFCGGKRMKTYLVNVWELANNWHFLVFLPSSLTLSSPCLFLLSFFFFTSSCIPVTILSRAHSCIYLFLYFFHDLSTPLPFLSFSFEDPIYFSQCHKRRDAPAAGSSWHLVMLWWLWEFFWSKQRQHGKIPVPRGSDLQVMSIARWNPWDEKQNQLINVKTP